MSAPAMQQQGFPEERMFRFAWILPLSGLVLSGILVWPMRKWIAAHLGIPLPTPFAQLTILDAPLRLLPLKALFELVMALNLPGRFLELPYDIFFSPDKHEWLQSEMDLYISHAIVWPWLCIPFWWMAGRGIDALITLKHQRIMPKINWVESTLGAILAVIYAVGFIGVLFAMTNHRSTRLINFASGSGLWTMLAVLSVIARFKQRRLFKKQQAAAQPNTASSPLAAISFPS